MQNKQRQSFTRISIAACSLFIFLTYSSLTFSWGRDGHAVVGNLAMEQLQPSARSELEKIMGSLDRQSMLEACNWPDAVRETDLWKWSYPLHYINIPRGDFQYLESRDCPTQMCATEAIKRYATELSDKTASREKRWQAFAWLCHLTGDLHQPLHAGFADDRGGNNFEVSYNGEQTNLHSLWDSKLIASHTNDLQSLTQLLSELPKPRPNTPMYQELINNWTNESHELAKNQVYPASRQISESYEEKSWELIQQRLNIAAIRLALMVNSVFKQENSEQ